MMSWAAANAPKARSSIEKRAEEAGTTGVPTSPKKRRATETVEAALSRLSKAYTTSMECIGALNKTNQMLQKEAIVSDEQLAVLERVSNAARKSLENGILLDPLVLMHVPTLNMTMQNFASGDEGSSLSMDRWESVKEKRPQPPTLSSAAHKSTIRELTYLALVNYADLLLSCCVFKMDDSSQEEKRRNISILDRGVVRKLHVLNDKNHNCWRGESHEDTQRLAVTALCDASNLDGSDPTLWLKLASASRGLENLVVKDDDPSTLVTKYRRLQRYALERGSKALPPQMPPNRTVTRALNEINSEPEPESYRPSFVSDTETMKLTFELPRYSWSMLGRFLTKACREGSDFQQPFHRQHHRSQFGSPAVELHLSPMLVLPARVLGRVCLFLENSSIWRFEATCRALSVSIMSARASMEKESGAEKAPPTKPNNKADNERATDNLAESTAPATDTATTAVSEQGGTRADATVDVPNGTAEQENLEGFSETQTSRRNSRPNVPAHLCRTSKRLRSQQITSGKKSERSWKRKSFDYCFLASTLSTTRHQHQENMKTLPSALLAPRSAYRSDLLVGRGNTRNDSNDSRDVHNREALERISGSSLPAFVELWNGRNSGPLDLLTNYLIHVANNVEDVFASDPSGAVVLASCLLGCKFCDYISARLVCSVDLTTSFFSGTSGFQILKRKAGYQQGFTYSIFQPTTKTRSMFRSLNLFATDLLHAELILRQCDRYSPVHVEFDDDSNQISIMVPTLLEACEEMEKVISEDVDTKLKARVEKRFDLLKVRCYWLAAGFYLWRSRISRMIWEAREAEDEGIDYILEAKKCFESPALGRKKIIFTPHLVSPGRTEQHWKEISFETLTKVRDDLQASSVVSLARQKFLDLVGSIEREQSKRILGANDTEEKEAGEEAKRTDGNSQDYADRNKLSEADTKALAEIGEILLERYSFPYGDSEAKHAELVDDFLACHGDNISILAGIDTDERMQKLQGILPLGETNALDLMGMANPSIFTMLTICLRMKTENRSKSFELMVHLVMTSIDIHNSLIQRILDAKAIQRRGGTGNEDFSDSEDESVMSDDDSIDRDAANKDADAKKARQCCHLVSVLIERIGVEFSDYMSKEEQSTTLSSKDTATTIRSAMILSSNLFQTNIKRLSLPEDGSDQSLFKSVRTLISRLCVSADETVRRELQLEFFNLSVEAFLLQRQYLESLVSSQSQRTGRAARQKQCIKRAEFIRMLGGELGNMLSQNLGKVKGFQMTRSDFLRLKSNGDGDIGRKEWEFSDLKLHMLVDSLLSLWKYVSKVDSDVANAGKNQAPMCSSFDKPVIKELRVAIASLIVGLCGSATSTRSKSRTTANRENEDVAGDGVDDSETTDQLDLTEFFDSDASAVDWASDSSSDVNKDRKELLRSICHAVHCISQVLEWIDDKEALSLPISQGNYTFGPVLPLVTVRVLNHFADIILLNFEDEEVVAAPSVWTEKFPSRTETVGELLDSNLHKVYRWLYGFVLVGDKAHYSSGIGKDTVASTVAPLTELSAKSTVPESTTAAAQLYRCIVRAYSSGRRSPPKTSLELVSSALPPLEESEKSRSLRDFLFTSYGHNYFSLDDVVRVVKKEEGWLSPFENIRGHLGVDTTPYDPVIAEEEEAISVRRGISSQLAKGPLPAFTTDSGKNKSDTTPEDDRSATVRFEKELSKKFFAILEDICLGGIQQGAEGWYRAAQCLTMKAELIADRLGFSRGFSRSTDFVSPESRPSSNRGWDLAQLEAEQEHEAKMREQNSVPYLGNDLSVYMRYAWSSFASLKNCSSVIAAQKSLSEIEGVVLREIDSFHDSRDYLEWQEAWGGIFISALRKLSLRFLCVALYETHSGNTTGKEDNVLKSELRETTGIALYTELMASQKYGYPMREIVPKMKRDIAAASKECFQAAVDILDSSTMDDDTDGRATWDLLFMIGKVRNAQTRRRIFISPAAQSFFFGSVKKKLRKHTEKRVSRELTGAQPKLDCMRNPWPQRLKSTPTLMHKLR